MWYKITSSTRWNISQLKWYKSLNLDASNFFNTSLDTQNDNTLENNLLFKFYKTTKNHFHLKMCNVIYKSKWLECWQITQLFINALWILSQYIFHHISFHKLIYVPACKHLKQLNLSSWNFFAKSYLCPCWHAIFTDYTRLLDF